MKLHEFVDKYIGTKVDFDKAFGAQCVDLARQYFQDVWNVPQPEGVIGAQDFYFKHENRPVQKRHMDCITYKGLNPPVGAVVIFKACPANRFGHIGICLSSDDNTITLFEQDGFKQDGAKITKWHYDLLVGWLIKKEL